MKPVGIKDKLLVEIVCADEINEGDHIWIYEDFQIIKEIRLGDGYVWFSFVPDNIL